MGASVSKAEFSTVPSILMQVDLRCLGGWAGEEKRGLGGREGPAPMKPLGRILEKQPQLDGRNLVLGQVFFF